MRFRNTIPKLNSTTLNKRHRFLSRLIHLIILLLISFPLLFGQSKKALETKRKKLINDIRLTTRLIKKASKNKAAALDRYITLKKQIQNRQELVETLQLELDYVIENLERTKDVITSLEEDIQRLEKEYATMVRQAYRHKVHQSDLLFLLSSDSFNQAFRRWKYLRQYDTTRKKQPIWLFPLNQHWTINCFSWNKIKLTKKHF